MTALQLFLYILGALLIQGILGAGIAVWRVSQNSASPALQTTDLQANSIAPAWQGLREFRVVRQTFEDPSNSQCSFELVPVDGKSLPEFQPGQFLTFSIPAEILTNGLDAAVAPVVRCYSMSARPEATSYRVTIKRALPPLDRPELPPGLVSNFFLDKVGVGDVLKAKAPAGRFFLDPDPKIPAVFLAGGIGITPILSMLRWSLTNHPTRELHLFYGVRSSEDHAFKSELEDLAKTNQKFHLVVLYAQPGQSGQKGRDFHETGFIDIRLLERSLPDKRRQFYVCGPPGMMASVIPALRDWGVREEDIRSESFGPAAMPPKQGSAATQTVTPLAQYEIRFARSGRTLTWTGDDANLLDFAERNRIIVDSGCRNGSCGSCETKLLTGKVHYSLVPEFKVNTGHCLICIASPNSALVLEV
jgi:ferredoxin-NADP reductase